MPITWVWGVGCGAGMEIGGINSHAIAIYSIPMNTFLVCSGPLPHPVTQRDATPEPSTALPIPHSAEWIQLSFCPHPAGCYASACQGPIMPGTCPLAQEPCPARSACPLVCNTVMRICSSPCGNGHGGELASSMSLVVMCRLTSCSTSLESWRQWHILPDPPAPSPQAPPQAGESATHPLPLIRQGLSLSPPQPGGWRRILRHITPQSQVEGVDEVWMRCGCGVCGDCGGVK